MMNVVMKKVSKVRYEAVIGRVIVVGSEERSQFWPSFKRSPNPPKGVWSDLDVGIDKDEYFLRRLGCAKISRFCRTGSTWAIHDDDLFRRLLCGSDCGEGFAEGQRLIGSRNDDA
jgi:hypothetical protein